VIYISVNGYEQLKDQFEALCTYGLTSLKGQFPFLDSKAIDSALKDKISKYFEKIDNPLLPIYHKPLTDLQIMQIQRHWCRLYKNRDMFWRHTRGQYAERTFIEQDIHTKQSMQQEFACRVLDDLTKASWMVIDRPPEYVLQAIAAMKQEQNKDKSNPRDVLKQIKPKYPSRQVSVENWIFILAALLETSPS